MPAIPAVAVMVADVPAQIADELTVTVGGILTVTVMVTGSPGHPFKFVSITFKVAVPALVQLTVIKFGVAPDIIVPLPPAIGVILHA